METYDIENPFVPVYLKLKEVMFGSDTTKDVFTEVHVIVNENEKLNCYGEWERQKNHLMMRELFWAL